jgi:hypothetical protein
LQLRQEQAKPALDELHSWLLVTAKTVATGSGTAKAIDYALKRWPALLRYADSGTLPIDNNPVENASDRSQWAIMLGPRLCWAHRTQAAAAASMDF